MWLVNGRLAYFALVRSRVRLSYGSLVGLLAVRVGFW